MFLHVTAFKKVLDDGPALTREKCPMFNHCLMLSMQTSSPVIYLQSPEYNWLKAVCYKSHLTVKPNRIEKSQPGFTYLHSYNRLIIGIKAPYADIVVWQKKM